MNIVIFLYYNMSFDVQLLVLYGYLEYNVACFVAQQNTLYELAK